VPIVTIGECTLIRGDCFDVLPKLDGVKCDAVITDTPMEITDCAWDIKPPLESMWNLLDARTKPTANFVLFGCGRFSFELVQSKMEWFRYDLIWQKNVVAGFLNANLMPLRNFMSIFIFGRPGTQKQATYNPIKVFDKKNVGKRIGGGLGETRAVYNRAERMVFYSDGWMHPRSILPFDSDNQGIAKEHPCQKPVALMEWLIRTYANVGETVLDPFMSSASTAIACLKTGRRFIGIEKDPEFFDTAVQRLRAFEWLRKTLVTGSVEVDAIKVDGKKAGFSLPVLQRASKDLGVVSGKHSKKRVWSLPEPNQPSSAEGDSKPPSHGKGHLADDNQTARSMSVGAWKMCNISLG
jgi:site-specific DNA-methyltransferase (adenine-specific)